MRTVTTLVATALAALAMTSASRAQECVNGYRTLGNGVIVACQVGTTARTTPPAAADPAATRPVSSSSRQPARSGSLMVDNIVECKPGHYWTMRASQGGGRLMPC